LMGQFFTRIDNLGALTNSGTNMKIYDQKVRDTIAEMHGARSLKWPPSPANRVLLQYQVTDWKGAVRDWKDLQKQNALPADQIHSESPPGKEEENEHIMIKSLISGRTIAVACSQVVEQMTDVIFVQLIAGLVGIYWRRIMLFKPDSTLLTA